MCLQSGVAILEICLDLCGMEPLCLVHRHDEIAYVNPFGAPQQSPDFLKCGQPLVASRQECCSSPTERQSAAYQ